MQRNKDSIAELQESLNQLFNTKVFNNTVFTVHRGAKSIECFIVTKYSSIIFRHTLAVKSVYLSCDYRKPWTH